MSKENKNGGQNRCKRCDRPLSNPNDVYGWRCAQIVGANKYDEIASMLDVNAMEMYNRYMVDYLSKDNDGKYRYTNVRSVNGDNSMNKVAWLPNTDWKTASEIIAKNATAIKNAGKYYEVNPAIIAACIYTEQTTNVNVLDYITDVPAYFADTSIGIGQVKVSTAKMLEDAGYIEKTTYSHSYQDWHAQSYITKDVWYAPAYGYVEGSREKAIAYRLTNESENVNYVAAYLRYFQDRWKPYYPEIDGRTAILATLFNQGEIRSPHGNPQANPFGEQAKKEYHYMKDLLGLD